MILASIITFNPDIELLIKNIQAVEKQVDNILLIDNNSSNKEKFINILREKNITILENEENKGIAAALNQALYYAQGNGYEWVLTLDQDSVCEKNMILKYSNFITSCKGNSKILLLCPRIEDINIKKTNFEKYESEEVDTAITSGSFLNVENSVKIGGFLGELFIDYVDFEFCLRGILSEYKIIRLNNVVLFHRLGDIKEKRIFGVNLIVTNHNPLRRYYLFRNKIYVYRKYWGHFNSWIIRNILSSIKTFLIILVYEKNKVANVKNVYKGIRDSRLLFEKDN